MKKIPNRPPEGQMVAGPPDTGGAEAGRRQNKVWSILLAIQMENTEEISINHKYHMIYQ